MIRRISEAQVELAKSKKVAGEYEQRFLAKSILAEAAETSSKLEAEVEKKHMFSTETPTVMCRIN